MQSRGPSSGRAFHGLGIRAQVRLVTRKSGLPGLRQSSRWTTEINVRHYKPRAAWQERNRGAYSSVSASGKAEIRATNRWAVFEPTGPSGLRRVHREF